MTHPWPPGQPQQAPYDPYAQQQPYPDIPQQWAPPAPPPAPARRKVWPWVLLGFVLVPVLGFVGCTALLVGAAGSSDTRPVTGGAATADGPKGDAQAGQTVDVDGVQITAAPLARQRDAGQSLLCSKVTYVNGSNSEQSFNGGFDWKLQYPDGVIKGTSLLGDDLLSAGQLAPGGTVTGNICFDHAAKSGDYYIINDGLLSFAGPTRWKAALP